MKTPAQIVARPFRSSASMAEMPEILRALAGDLEEWAEKLGSKSETRGDVLNPKHDLIHWPEHAPLVLEVAGEDHKLSLYAIRVEGRVVDEFLKEGLWDDAENYLAELNTESRAQAEELRHEHNRQD